MHSHTLEERKRSFPLQFGDTKLAVLDLSVDPQILLIQSAIFLTNVVVIKKLMLDPYVLLRQKRDSETIGKEKQTMEAQKELVEKEVRYSDKIKSALSQAKLQKEQKRQGYLKQQKAEIDALKADVDSMIQKSREALRSQIQEEKAKIPDLVKKLAAEVYESSVKIA